MGGGWISPTLQRRWFSREMCEWKWRALESLIIGWNRRNYFGCIANFQLKCQVKAMGQNHRSQTERECSCTSISDVPRAAPPVTGVSSFELLTTAKEDQEFWSQTLNYPHCVIWIAFTGSLTHIYREPIMCKSCVGQSHRDPEGNKMLWLPWRSSRSGGKAGSYHTKQSDKV